MGLRRLRYDAHLSGAGYGVTDDPRGAVARALNCLERGLSVIGRTGN